MEHGFNINLQGCAMCVMSSTCRPILRSYSQLVLNVPQLKLDIRSFSFLFSELAVALKTFPQHFLCLKSRRICMFISKHIPFSEFLDFFQVLYTYFFHYWKRVVLNPLSLSWGVPFLRNLFLFFSQIYVCTVQPVSLPLA